MIILIVITLFILLILLFILVSNFWASYVGSPYLKSKKEIIRVALKTAKLKPGEVFYDLGCGNGDVLLAAQKLGAKAVGVEISPFYYFFALARTRGKNIEIKFQNIKDVEIYNADIVYCYLMPCLLENLAEKFKKIKKTTRVISVDFPIKELNAVCKEKFKDHIIYIYSRRSLSD